MKEEKRIYVVIPATVRTVKGIVAQPHGRQIAQACHAVSKLRDGVPYTDITTIILQARDEKEARHNLIQLAVKKLKPVFFVDKNYEAYGSTEPMTAIAVLAAPSEVVNILDYLPLWGS